MNDKPNILLILNDDMGYSDLVREMTVLYEAWAKRCNVLPWDAVVRLRQEKKR